MDAFIEVWMETGRVTKTLGLRRFTPIHDIGGSVGPEICGALPALHALTGCDTVSSFFVIGKKTALNTAQAIGVYDLRCLQALTGDDSAALDAFRQFLAKMYDLEGKFKEAHIIR